MYSKKKKKDTYIDTIEVYYLGSQIPCNKFTMAALNTKHKAFDAGAFLLQYETPTHT